MIKSLGEVEKNPETNQMESLLKTFVLIVIHKARSSLYCIYFYNIGYNPVGERRCSCHQIYKRCEGQFVKYHRFPPRRVIVFFCQVLNQYRVSTQAVQFLTREFIFFCQAIFCDCYFLYFSGTLNFMGVCVSLPREILGNGLNSLSEK